MKIPYKILFCVTSLSFAGVILIIFGIVTLFGLFGVSAFGTEYSLFKSIIFFLIVAPVGFFDLIAAYLIFHKKEKGRKYGRILAFLGLLPGQSLFITIPFSAYTSQFTSNPLILFIVLVVVLMLLFLTILGILMTDKTYFPLVDKN